LVQPVHAKFLAPTRIFEKSPKAVERLRSLNDNFPTMSWRLLNVSVTQSWLAVSSCKHIMDRAVGYISCTSCVTVSPTPLVPSVPKSLAQPVVTFATTAAKVSLLQNPLAQRPVSQLLTVSGTDWALPTKKPSNEEGLRHAASGEARIPFKEFVQSVERLKDWAEARPAAAAKVRRVEVFIWTTLKR